MLHDFYSIIIKIKHKIIHSPRVSPPPPNEKLWVRAFLSNCWRFPSRRPAILHTRRWQWHARENLSQPATHSAEGSITRSKTDALYQSHDPFRGLSVVRTVCLHSVIRRRLQPVTRRRSPATTVGALQCVAWDHANATVASAVHFTKQKSGFGTNVQNSNSAPPHSIAANVRANSVQQCCFFATPQLKQLYPH
jgi:hypothetical protein